MLGKIMRLAALCCGLLAVPGVGSAAPLVISFEGILTNVHPIYDFIEEGQRAYGYFVVDPAVPAVEYPPGSGMKLFTGTPLRSRISVETPDGTYFIGADGSFPNGSTWVMENSPGADDRTFTGLSIESHGLLGPLVTNFPDISPWDPVIAYLIAGAYSVSDRSDFVFDPEADFPDYAALFSTAPVIEFAFGALLWDDPTDVLVATAMGLVTSVSIRPLLAVPAPGALAIFGVGLVLTGMAARRRRMPVPTASLVFQ